MEGRQPHRWTRPTLVLPSQTVETGFSNKVLEHVRQRRSRPSSLAAKLAAQALLHEGQDHQLLPHLTPEVPGEAKPVRPKYLQTSLVHQHLTPRAPKPPPGPPSGRPRSAPGPEGHHPAQARREPRTPRPKEVGGVADLEASGLEIVEAPTSLVVNTDKGTMRIPPYHWLVVDAPSPSSTPRRQAERYLSGGGCISHGGSLLRRISQERLHAGAAEANFQRASRGTSELALRHAAVALEILYQCDREVPGVPRTARATAVAAAATPSSPSLEWAEPERVPQTDVKEEVSSRLQRMQALVAVQAKAAEVRDSMGTPTKDLRPELEAPAEPGGRFSKRSVLQRGIQARLEFVEFAQRRYGNTIRAWWKLDQEENLKLGEKLFVRRCVDLGFRGNVTALWRFVDADHSGSVTMLELDPAAAVHLASFKMLIDSKFGSNPDKVFAAVDNTRTGRVSKQEFVDVLKGYKYDGPPGRLFELLDRRGLGYVVRSDMTFLGRWHPRPYLFTNPDMENLQRLKEALIDTYRSLLKAWRKCLDRDGKMRVCWEEFCAACRRVSRAPALNKSGSGYFNTEQEIAGVWRALDEDCSGWISLREFDPISHGTLAEFKRWADSTYKGAIAAYHEIDGNSNGKLQLWELQKASKGPNGYKGDVELLFESLDVNSAGFLTESEFRFLDNWDLEWEEWEASIRSGARARSSFMKNPMNAAAADPRMGFIVPMGRRTPSPTPY